MADFEFYIEDDHAVVKKYCGENTEVIIPEQYDGFPVTHIAGFCFRNTNVMTIVGKSITSIGYKAFYFCESLLSVNLPICKHIESYAFCYCTNLTTANFPVCEFIGTDSFRNCHSLANVNFSICTLIDAGAFCDCTSLIKKGKYKATYTDLTCRGFQYEIGQWFEEDEAILCEKGFHYVENFYDIFNYYCGILGEDLRIFEVETEEISEELGDDSKRVCKRIRLVKEIKSYNEMFDTE